MRPILFAAALFLSAGPALGRAEPPLAAQIDQAIAAAPPGTRFGILVTSLDGTEIYARDPDQRFIPASNTKLFTTAAALALLGPLTAPDAAAGAGVALESGRGRAVDAVLYGMGDARLSGAPDCIVNCLVQLADAIAVKTRRVANVIGDDRLFPDERWSPGMSWNNIGGDAGGAISALTLDDNVVPVIVTPTQPGQPPQIVLSPYYILRNDAVTAPAGTPTALRIDRAVNGLAVRIHGRIAADAAPWRDGIGIDDPAHHAAWTLKEMLAARGVKVSGTVQARHRPLTLGDEPALRGAEPVVAPGQPQWLARVVPPPLAEDLALVNKRSNNLHAELLLRRIGRANGSGSLADGTAALVRVLDAAGIPRGGYELHDGSGMSTYNRISPRAAAALLRWGADQPWGALWRSSMAVGAADGTLQRRFAGTPLAGRIEAKTGSLNATNTLSGYLTAASGQLLIVSILANDVPGDFRAVPVIDRIAGLIAAAN